MHCTKKNYWESEEYRIAKYLLRVNRNVYGANDAGRVWFDLISGVLMGEMDFRRCQIDRCCFLKVAGTQRVVLLLYVDDLLILGTEPLRSEIVGRIRARFPVTEGGADYLGLQISHDTENHVLGVTQEQFARAVCRKWGYEDAKPAASPLPTAFVTTSTPATLGVAPPVADKTAAAIDMKSFAGQLGYLATRTMPHLLFAFCKMAEAAQPSKACPDAPTPFHRPSQPDASDGYVTTRTSDYASNAFANFHWTRTSTPASDASRVRARASRPAPGPGSTSSRAARR